MLGHTSPRHNPGYDAVKIWLMRVMKDQIQRLMRLVGSAAGVLDPCCRLGLPQDSIASQPKLVTIVEKRLLVRSCLITHLC